MAIGSTVYSCTFFKEINHDSSFHPPAWPTLLTAAPGTFSLPESQCVSISWIVISIVACRSKPMLNTYKICFSVHVTHSSVNFTWFAEVSSWCDGLGNHSKRVRPPVALLRSLSGKYPWERYEPPYPPSYGLNSTTTVLQGEWLWH